MKYRKITTKRNCTVIINKDAFHPNIFFFYVCFTVTCAFLLLQDIHPLSRIYSEKVMFQKVKNDTIQNKSNIIANGKWNLDFQYTLCSKHPLFWYNVAPLYDLYHLRLPSSDHLFIKYIEFAIFRKKKISHPRYLFNKPIDILAIFPLYVHHLAFINWEKKCVRGKEFRTVSESKTMFFSS